MSENMLLKLASLRAYIAIIVSYFSLLSLKNYKGIKALSIKLFFINIFYLVVRPLVNYKGIIYILGVYRIKALSLYIKKLYKKYKRYFKKYRVIRITNLIFFRIIINFINLLEDNNLKSLILKKITIVNLRGNLKAKVDKKNKLKDYKYIIVRLTFFKSLNIIEIIPYKKDSKNKKSYYLYNILEILSYNLRFSRILENNNLYSLLKYIISKIKLRLQYIYIVVRFLLRLYKIYLFTLEIKVRLVSLKEFSLEVILGKILYSLELPKIYKIDKLYRREIIISLKFIIYYLNSIKTSL
ncbi:hypothetical protein LZ32DRAFT_617280 [Colletotrichum eremochloae]|nr:hypothetical protein LZ32DRAFT_617280 [Colletotrichum eremochloae]